MAQVRLPRSLVTLFADAPPRRVELEAPTVDAVIDALEARWPGMRDRLCEPARGLREHINVFVDGERAGLSTAVAATSEVFIVPAVSGG